MAGHAAKPGGPFPVPRVIEITVGLQGMTLYSSSPVHRLLHPLSSLGSVVCRVPSTRFSAQCLRARSCHRSKGAKAREPAGSALAPSPKQLAKIGWLPANCSESGRGN